MLAKHLWRIYSVKNLLVSKVFVSKYVNGTHQDPLKCGKISSPIWKCLSMLFVVGFIFLFTIRGLTRIVTGIVPFGKAYQRQIA